MDPIKGFRRWANGHERHYQSIGENFTITVIVTCCTQQAVTTDPNKGPQSRITRNPYEGLHGQRVPGTTATAICCIPKRIVYTVAQSFTMEAICSRSVGATHCRSMDDTSIKEVVNGYIKHLMRRAMLSTAFTCFAIKAILMFVESPIREITGEFTQLWVGDGG